MRRLSVTLKPQTQFVIAMVRSPPWAVPRQAVSMQDMPLQPFAQLKQARHRCARVHPIERDLAPPTRVRTRYGKALGTRSLNPEVCCSTAPTPNHLGRRSATVRKSNPARALIGPLPTKSCTGQPLKGPLLSSTRASEHLYLKAYR